LTGNVEIDKMRLNIRGPIKTRITTKRRLIGGAICAGIVLLAGMTNALAQYNFTTLSVPGAVDTSVYGISDGDMVGTWDTGSGSDSQGFIYNGSSYTTLNVPGVENTYVSGIDGNNIVGWYDNEGTIAGFLYDGNSFTILSVPYSQSTTVTAISGNNIIGNYVSDESYNPQSYLYNNDNYTILNVPGQVNGIEGNYIVGNYPVLNGGNDGFVYNGTSYTTLIVPGARYTFADGISGNIIVGTYSMDGSTFQSFIYDGNSYITLSVPGAEDTYVYGIDGDNIVGSYYNGSVYEGFLATPVPEPSVLALATVGAGALLVRLRERGKRRG